MINVEGPKVHVKGGRSQLMTEAAMLYKMFKEDFHSNKEEWSNLAELVDNTDAEQVSNVSSGCYCGECDKEEKENLTNEQIVGLLEKKLETIKKKLGIIKK